MRLAFQVAYTVVGLAAVVALLGLVVLDVIGAGQ